jgi:Ser/Thr protein kinase RdoA (MazF antagonist)
VDVLVADDQVTMIDLDVATYQWFAVDLAATLRSITGEGDHVDALAAEHARLFLDAYLEAHPLEQRWLDALPVHLAYRRALLFIALFDELEPPAREEWRRAVLGRDTTGPWSMILAGLRTG